MKLLNEKEIKIIITATKKEKEPLELSIGAKYQVTSEGISEVRNVVVEPSGEVKGHLNSFIRTIVTLIKQKEEIGE